MGSLVEKYKREVPDLSKPVKLYEEGEHEVVWVGSSEDFIFRCNAYLVKSGDKAVLIDPGGIQHFRQVKKRVEEVLGDAARVTHVVAHHQDPDVAGSIPEWLKVNPDITVITTPRTKVLLPYYGFDRNKVKWLDVGVMDDTILDLPRGGLLFLSAPFLHFPDAFVTYDIKSGFLFSGDIFAAIQQEWNLVVTEEKWEKHKVEMMYFHVYYMASNKALRHFVKKVKPFPIKTIVPQHGSIIPEQLVGKAMDFLENLKCGIDLLEEESPVKSLIDELF